MTNQQQAKTVLTRPKDTAEVFQISVMTLHRWSKAEGFPRALKRGQVVLYNIEAITAWLAGGGA